MTNLKETKSQAETSLDELSEVQLEISKLLKEGTLNESTAQRLYEKVGRARTVISDANSTIKNALSGLNRIF